MITIEVHGHGKYTVSRDKLGELLNWLKTNSMPLEVSSQQMTRNQKLLNE
jgi:hypothetical protein